MGWFDQPFYCGPLFLKVLITILLWVGSVRDALTNSSGMALGGWYVTVWVKRKERWLARGLAHNLDKNGWLKTVLVDGAPVM